ncbi:5-formyltetrahydrofolate cyclo-ligase [Sinorhizobium terangae]|uniref:5-formyltetrahydrofolate cyclo-ligase n=1 Tax=Sinorhizobium terangae TaxID=110322 RepID=A0A6N7LJB0_SINTE|nr:5-formyltetrahydrofolate cyclo-ligase [Sinorhizobium terangae]MBB4186565.1 5,10-methenyltetrahydrofolate synthetase [Sinorhizobium terangae]MQX17867.1 5-formyltetrahydrofolate cyclo-ligase [Sinorhizobium terangae]WFU50814.1 5-formyltetrahydrofolate cyclo-ligase [Sinorhizobium terangae]
MDIDDDIPATFASPPCLMHELDPAYAGLSSDPGTCADVKRWRKSERARLIAQRLAMSPGVRAACETQIVSRVLAEIGDVRGLVVSVYWPFRGEPDLRPLMRQIADDGGQCALPVVVEKGQPLEFHLWRPGDKLVRGIWNIPVPAEHVSLTPDIVVAPVVGFDPSCYRLGYGGGYYDRTLARMAAKRRVLGVGFAQSRIRTIYPQLHDIRMDVVVTESSTDRYRRVY